ncbi:serine hydrolase domain-containing protein [Microbacterium sp. NPDC058345]|uniref:serine hydrolase domain-containing protein n=1 Tax=Microbacterium sp. NPDC058345 TaxID=3346455 RepID=UPI0036484123
MIFDELVERFERQDRGITHLLAARNGRVIGEWYRPHRSRTTAHMLHSATKSFVSTGIGMAVDEGRLNLDDRLADFLTLEQVRSAQPGVELLTIADLLTMRTGHAEGTSGVVWRTLSTSWIDAYLQVPIAGTPGESFIYSSGTSHMLSMCLQKATGLPADEYLRPRLFDPLDFGTISWDRDPDGYCSGGNGLTMNVLDFLKWGQLYLNGGVWDGRQLVSREWVDASLARQVDVGSLGWTGDGYVAGASADPGAGEGYGYQIWNRPHGAYAAGVFGQYCVLVPEADAVVAVFSSMTSRESDPLSADLIEALRSEQFASFVAPFTGALTTDGVPDSARYVSGMLDGEFASPDETTKLMFSVEHRHSGALLHVQGHDRSGPVEFTAGIDADHEGRSAMGAPSLHHSYIEPTTSVARLTRRGPWWVEVLVDYPITPFVDRFSFRLSTDGLIRYSRSVNVNSQSTELAEVALHRRNA